jgi:alpha-L-fucosidase 2
MDQTLLQGLYPLLTRAVNFYRHFIIKKENTYHLPTTFSPEYPLRGPDTNYDIALLRWAVQTLLEISKILKIKDPLIPGIYVK